MTKHSNSCKSQQPSAENGKALNEPSELAQNMLDLQWDTEILRMPSFDLEAVLAEDAYDRANSIGPDRFAYPMEVNLTMDNSGEWQTDADGNRYWLLEIESPGAGYMNIFAQDYYIPPGAQFVFYDETQTHITELTHDYHELHDFLVLWPGIPGDKISIEYHESPTQPGKGKLDIDTVIHDYTNSRDFEGSGDCNINVACDATWDAEEQTVALIIDGGTRWCSGAMINNTSNDENPYFLTANHCLEPDGGTDLEIADHIQQNWTFVFNYESTSCDTNNDGPLGDTLTGASLIAHNSASDFALLRLNPPINTNWVDNWDVEFAGWNADPDYVPLQGTGIHHPSGDVKKICFETDAPYKVTKYPGTSNEAEVWYIDQWEEGVTEHGSSGSPLFDPHHRIIGQLYGGTAACNGNVNNGEPDWYGRFDVTYTFLETLNPNPLDPQNILDSGNWVWDGTAAFSFPIGTDIELTSIEGLTYSTCLIGNENAVTITLTNLALENIAVADIQLIYGVKDSVSGVT